MEGHCLQFLLRIAPIKGFLAITVVADYIFCSSIASEGRKHLDCWVPYKELSSLGIEINPVSRTLCFLVFRLPDYSYSHIPPSEPFIIYLAI
jgi:hypothetical protein